MSSTESLPISERVFGYRPNSALAITAATAYGLVGAALILRVIRSKAWWALCLPIGSFFLALGFSLRAMSKYSPRSLLLFATEYFLIICAPAAFLAFNYMTYGRLISYIGAEHSIINPQKVARTFVFSDIFTFLMQAAGSGLQASDKMTKTGQKILLVGLILQAISYGVFCVLLVKSHISIRSDGGSLSHKSSIVLIYALYFSSALISVRCIYRVAEFAQGLDGYLVTHEVFLYVLDALPLLLAIVVYVLFWPTKYIEHGKHEGLEMSEGIHP